MNEPALIANIFELFPIVRYAAIWEDHVKTHGGMREDKESYLSAADEKEAIALAIQKWIEENDRVDKLGNQQYHLTVKEKVRLYTIRLKPDKFLMISTEPDEMSDGLINSILELDTLSQ